jgi:hypothetical protein
MAGTFLPHDGAKKDDGQAIARIQNWRKLGIVNSSLLRKESLEDGIRRAIQRLNQRTTTINVATTSEFLRKLALYKRKFNTFTGDYEGPKHDSTSHYADNFRYVNAAIEQGFRDDGTPYMTLLTDKKKQEPVENDDWGEDYQGDEDWSSQGDEDWST